MKRFGWICVLLAGGCGDGGESSVGSGVDGSLVISTLSADQLERVCRAQIEWGFAQDSIEEDCTLEGVFETKDLPACREWVDACVAEAKEGAAKKKRERLAGCARSELHCDYTVEAYERCYKEEAKEWSQLASEYSCREAGDYEESEYPDDGVESEECQKILGTCYIY